MIRPSAWILPLLFCGVANGWGADAAPLEELDERSGATTAMMRAPFVFADERSSLVSEARDYITLSAVEVDHTGRLQMYLVAHAWSRVDWRAHPSPVPPVSMTLELDADGDIIPLTPLEVFPEELAMTTRRLKPPAAAIRAAYPASLEMLKKIQKARNLRLTRGAAAAGDPATNRSYQVWEDAHLALQSFLERADTFR